MPSADFTLSLILASGSPRRHALLKAAGLEFTISESGIKESRKDGEGGTAFALRMAQEKALSVASRNPSALVLAADTIVECEGEILGKPADAAAARRSLRMLSGRSHTVVTAYALARGGAIIESAAVSSRVTFRELADDEIERYLATGEPFDKAGAYGIQGMGADFIASVEGTRDNVMGLPVAEVLEALAREGVLPQPQL